MSDPEKVVAELRASATKLEKTFKVAPPLKLDESELMRRAADLIAHQAARLEEVTRALAQARVNLDLEGEEHANTREALTAAEAEKERLRDALRTLVYETTHLSPCRDDGSHDCRISRKALADARAVLSPAKKEGDA